MSQNRKSPDDDWEELDISRPKSDGLAGVMKKLKRWAKQNPTQAKGVAAGALLLLVVLLLLGLLTGLLGGGGKPAPVAAVPQVPTPVQAIPPPQQAKAPGQNPPEQPKKVEPAKAPPPSVPDDVSTWKREDFFRARQQNNPKLPLAIAFLTEKAPGSEPVAQGLTELLKPLPPEAPVASSQPAPTPSTTLPGPGATPPLPRPTLPGPGPVPPMPGATPPGPGLTPPSARCATRPS